MKRCLNRLQKKAGADRVISNILKSTEMGFKVKVNCVPLMDVSDQKPEMVASLAKDYPVDIRYIELMPIGCGKRHQGIAGDDMLKRLAAVYGEYKTVDDKECMAGPASYVRFDGFRGKCGFINPMSHAFCSSCNRIRLTSDGFLKLCLHYDRGIDLKGALRGGAAAEEIADMVKNALLQKPEKHSFLESVKGESVGEEEERRMSQIGG